MSGLVICAQHGRQGGSLACDHVREAVKTGGPIKYRRVVQDFIGDGTGLVTGLLCTACISALGIDPERILPVEEDDEQSKRYPYVAPICDQCLVEYQKVRSV